MNLFAQIAKVDEEKRLVFGRAAEEAVDKADEIMDYMSSKPHFQKWSAEIAADTGGKNLGNVRAMHGKVAAGALKQIDFDDVGKTIDVCAHIVDDNEWKKVLGGVYTGFSIGGSYVGDKKVEKIADKNVTRYTAKPSEISLVDRPCMSGAKFFDVQKADGTLMKVQFAPVEEPPEVIVEGTADDVAALAKAMNDAGMSIKQVIEKIAERKDVNPKEGEHAYGDVKFADPVNKKYPIDTPEHIRAAWDYINKGDNASKYDPKDVSAIKSRIESAWKDKIDKDGPPSAEKLDKAAKGKKPTGSDGTAGSSGDTSAADGDGDEDSDAVPDDQKDEDVESDAMSEKMAKVAADLAEILSKPAILAKIGARNSSKDQKTIQSIHTAAVDLGAVCESSNGGANKAHEHGDLAKVLQQNTDLAKVVGELTERLKKIEEQPAKATISLRAVAKSDDLGTDANTVVNKVAPIVDDLGDPHEAAGLIKSLHRSGGAPLHAASMRKS